MLRAGTAPTGGAGLEKALDQGHPSSADEPSSYQQRHSAEHFVSSHISSFLAPLHLNFLTTLSRKPSAVTL